MRQQWQNQTIIGKKTLYKGDDGSYVISERHFGWLPGIYADEAAALAAFKYDYEQLRLLSDTVCPAGGCITLQMLKGLKKEAKK